MSNLNDVSQELSARLPGLALRWRAGEFDAAVFAALYFLLWQIATHGRAILIEFYRRRERKALMELLNAAAERAIEEVIPAVEVPTPRHARARRRELFRWKASYPDRCNGL